MTKKHIILALVLVCTSLIYIANTLNSKFAFESVDTSSWNEKARDHLKGNSEVDLLRNVLYFAGSEGDFRGSIKQSRLLNGNLIITIRDDYVPDDSIGPQEHRFTAKKNGTYEVIEYASRGSCKRYSSLWDVFLSVIIHPLWTKSPCS